MQIEIGYGFESRTAEVPDKNVRGVLYANKTEQTRPPEDLIRGALAGPTGSRRLCELAKGKRRVAVITSDITRPMPTGAVMPLVLEELNRAGVPDSAITLVFAVGSHRRHTREEMKKLAGDEAFSRIRCVDADDRDFVHLGETRHGTPVDVTRTVAEADLRVCIGNIEFHWFAGYSGGAKAIMPGVSTRAAIQINHSLLTERASVVRNADSPVRLDIEEAITYCPIDFILNVVLDEHKRIVHAVAGHYIEAHRAGCRVLDAMYAKPIPEEADIVLVSQGGMPKDLNLYQMQKALDNARHAVRKGGIIIWVGCAKEGFGEAVFEEWMLSADSPASILRRIQADFCIGGHKAAGIALTLEQADIFLVSDLEDDLTRRIFMTPFHDLQQALDEALRRRGPEAGVLVMPYGGSTLPVLDQKLNSR